MNNQNIINEIRSKIDIVDLISEYVPLSQKGKNYFGVCPFHNDTNPSMSVSREKQIYKCFSCGASGNIFTFVSEYENISFKEALSLLANKIGYKIDTGKSYTKPDLYKKYYDMYDLATKFYQNNINTHEGKEAKEYLKNRQINEEIIKRFQVGFSLDKKNSLIELLIKKGYTVKELVQYGLAVEDHDVYINRIMFPLYDTTGRVVAFSGRIYGNSKLNKYVNTKETPIFKKGHCLYNYHIAKEASRKKGFVIIMEGFMDVIRASTVGYDNVVALMGTALTSEQLGLIKRLSLNIILCFDGDGAGEHATMSAGEQLEKIGINPKVIALTGGEDPDTFIIKNGKERFDSLVESAINFSDYKIKALKSGVNFQSDIELSNYIDKVIKEVSLIKDDIRREIILKKLAIEVNIGYNTLEKRLDKYISESKPVEVVNPIKNNEKPHLTRYQKAVNAFLYNMMTNPDVIERYNRENICFLTPVNRYLANEISFYYEKIGSINIADMYTYLADKEELLALVKEITETDEYDCSAKAIDDYIDVINDYNKRQEIKRLNELIRKENDPMEKSKIAEQIRLIKIGESKNG